MSVRPSLRWGAVGALVLSGCGGGGHKAASSTHPAVSLPGGPPPSTTPVPPALRARVLIAGDFPGFTPQESRASASAQEAAGAMTEGPGPQRERDVARLRRLGFRAAVHERLAATGGGSEEAISIVQQFPSARAAASELAIETKSPAPHGSLTRFAVPGIPGARGFAASSKGFSGINVAFADGPYFYLVGAGWQNGFPAPPTRAALIGAAGRLYHRVRR